MTVGDNEQPCVACASTGRVGAPFSAFNPNGVECCTACGGRGKVPVIGSISVHQPADPKCACADIQQSDPLRHFRGCPLREPLPHGHEHAEDPDLKAVKDVLVLHDEDYGSDDERDPGGQLSPATCVERLIAERDALKKTVTQLQEDNTRLLEERRAVDEHYMVEHFHRVCEVPVLEKPQVPSEERVRLRLRLIAEEFRELISSAVRSEGVLRDEKFLAAAKLEQAWSFINNAIEYLDIDVDLPEFADACADLKYVIVGSELEFGIDGRPVFLGVHEANMKKADGPVRKDGKRLKPRDWKPFDVAAELRRQGWSGS